MAFSYALIISAIKKTNVHRYADSVHLSKSKIPCSEKYFPGKSGISIKNVAKKTDSLNQSWDVISENI